MYLYTHTKLMSSSARCHSRFPSRSRSIYVGLQLICFCGLQETEKLQWQIDEVLADSLKAQEDAQKQVEQARAAVEKGIFIRCSNCACNKIRVLSSLLGTGSEFWPFRSKKYMYVYTILIHTFMYVQLQSKS
jgi:hypothetical protein